LMDLEASKVPPGCDGLLFLPYLLGERAPWWNPHARGAFIGLTPSHNKPYLIRSVLEGVSLNLRIILDAFREQGLCPDALRLIGGGAKGDFWSNLLAQVLGVEILRPRYLEEATSLGAAIAGGVGVGIFKGLEVAKELIEIEDHFSPRAETVETYNRLYPIFKKAYLSLLPVFDDLSSF
jgi:xylulokinase